MNTTSKKIAHRKLLLLAGSLAATAISSPGQVLISGIDSGNTSSIYTDVTASSLVIAPGSATSGVLTILPSWPTTPFGSRLDLTGGPISIGDRGNGTLNVAAGIVSSSSGVPFIVGNHAGSYGQINLTGFYGYPQGGPFAVQDTAGLYVGGNAVLGNEAGANGIVTVAFQSSAYFFGTLTAGESGSGAYLSQSGQSDTVQGSLYAGKNAGASGSVTLEGAGTKLQVALGGGGASIGTQGVGSAYVSDGAALESKTYIYVGELSGSKGYLTVTGAGSIAEASTFLDVGKNGVGTAVVENGGKLVSGLGVWVAGGYSPGQTSSLTISGTGSAAEIGNDLMIGRAGTGVLGVLDGATLTTVPSNVAGATNSVVIGAQATGNGTLSVSGVGSQANFGTNVIVGRSGNGAVEVLNGGKVNITGLSSEGDGVSLAIANDSGSMGTVNVFGPGSELNLVGHLSAGDRGAALINVSNGGLLHVGGLFAVFGAGSGVGTGVISDGGKMIVDHYLAIGGEDTSALSSSLTINGGTVQSDTAFIAPTQGVHSVSIFNGGSFQATDTIYVGNDNRDLGFGPWGGSTGQLSVTSSGSVVTGNLDIIRGTVLVDGGAVTATKLTNESKGELRFNAGAITTTSLNNSGLFAIGSSAGDSKSVVGAFTNEHSGITTVALDTNSQVTFQGNVVNHGTMLISQKVATVGGITTFAGTFINAADGTFIQDPTTTHFTSLVNNGLFTAGFGDSVLVDFGLLNTGTFSLTGSFLRAGSGIQNDGLFDIFGGGTLDGLYTGTGNLVFHVTNRTDRLTLDDFFSGSIDIVFDDGYIASGDENFLFFGNGADLSDLKIGGVDYDLGRLTGSGFVSSRGTFSPFAAVPEPSTYTLGGVIALGGLVALRRCRRVKSLSF